MCDEVWKCMFDREMEGFGNSSRLRALWETETCLLIFVFVSSEEEGMFKVYCLMFWLNTVIN